MLLVQCKRPKRTTTLKRTTRIECFQQVLLLRHSNCSSRALTITLEAHRVAADPGGPVRTTLDVVGTVSALAQTTALASSGCESTHFAMLVGGVDNPVDLRVIANLLVRGVYQNHFVVLHCGVLVDPVRVQDTQVSVLASSLFFGKRLRVAFKFQLVNTLMPVGEVRLTRREYKEPSWSGVYNEVLCTRHTYLGFPKTIPR